MKLTVTEQQKELYQECLEDGTWDESVLVIERAMTVYKDIRKTEPTDNEDILVVLDIARYLRGD